MTKITKRLRIIILTISLILFSLLTVTTAINQDHDEDYIRFQFFRNYLKINKISMLDPTPSLNNEDEKVVHELDLALHIFLDSTLLDFYCIIHKDLYNSLNILKDNWNEFIYTYQEGGNNELSAIESFLPQIMVEVENIHDQLTVLDKRWNFFLLSVLILNLILFVLLLIIIILLSNSSDNVSGSGVMSVRNALIHGQEQERLRISLELHDKVAQDLFACRMIINDIKIEDDVVMELLSKSTSLLDSSIKEVRDLSYSLRPPALQAIGLDSAIQSYIDNFSKKIDTNIIFKAVGLGNKSIDETISINLYRILQETLNNTAKHAHAETIDVRLIYTYPYLFLKIEDDGVGFKYVKSEMKARGRNKLGLPGINERVSLLGGELIINTAKGEGTKVLIKVPIEGNEKV